MNDVTIQMPSVEICVVGGIALVSLFFSLLAMVRSRLRDRALMKNPIPFRDLIAGVLLFFATVMFTSAVGTFFMLLFGHMGDNPAMWWIPVLTCVFGFVFVAVSAIAKYA